MDCYIGVDIGTTNIKALALDPATNRVVGLASRPVETYHPQPGYAEQHPDEIWLAFSEVLRGAARLVRQRGGRIDTVAFSAGMHSLMAFDAQGKPLTPAILWSDNRAEVVAHSLKTDQADLGRKLYRQTGIPMHPMVPVCKLAYWRDQQPDLLRQAARFGSIKEYLWHRLTGQVEIDYSMATATGLFDESQKQWSPDAIRFAGIRPDQLANPVPTTHQQAVSPDAADGLANLLQGARLLIGASDGCLANLGAGAVAPGVTTLTIGTSGAVRQTVRQPLRDPQGRLFCYYLDEGYYVTGGPTNNGGNVLEWLSEKFTDQKTDAVLAEATSVPPGSDGLLFLPYLQGERAPLWNAAARGSFQGVDWQHTQAHFIRAGLEGVLLNLLTINHLLDTQTGPTEVIHANGGFARSDIWVQMLADMAGVPVRLNASNESGAMGAILLALKATGVVPSLDAAARRVEFGHTFEPDPTRHDVYRDAFYRFTNALTNQYGEKFG